jgi:hypothetical protein
LYPDQSPVLFIQVPFPRIKKDAQGITDTNAEEFVDQSDESHDPGPDAVTLETEYDAMIRQALNG